MLTAITGIMNIILAFIFKDSEICVMIASFMLFTAIMDALIILMLIN